MQIVQLWRFKISHTGLQLQQAYIYLDLDWEGGSLLITTENTTHKHSFIFFHSKWGFSFSFLRVFSRHHTGALDLRGVLFFCFFDRINQDCLFIFDRISQPHFSMASSESREDLGFTFYVEGTASDENFTKLDHVLLNWFIALDWLVSPV